MHSHKILTPGGGITISPVASPVSRSLQNTSVLYPSSFSYSVNFQSPSFPPAAESKAGKTLVEGTNRSCNQKENLLTGVNY